MNNDLDKHNKIKPFTFFIMLFAGLGGILYGYDIGVISGGLLFMQHDMSLTTAQLSIIAAAVLGGGSIATLISGPLSDFLGRRTMITLASIIFIVGIIIFIHAHHYHTALLGRLIQGIGVGIITVIIPLYLTEATPSNYRGRSLTIFQLFLTSGILLAYSVDLLFAGSGNWRGMFSCALIPGTILFLGSLILTESPRWLFSKGKKQQAKMALMRSHSTKEMEQDIAEMTQLHHAQKEMTMANFFKKLSQWRYVKPLLIALAIALLNQTTGINSIVQFSTFMLKSAGLPSNILSMLGSVGIGAINFIITAIVLLLIDKIGRKPLLIVGTLGVVISLLYCSFVELLPNYTTKGWLLMSGLFSFICFFALGPGVVVWLAISELLPMPIRSKGMAICLFINSLTSTVLASFFLQLAKTSGYQNVFWLCAAFTICYFLVATWIMPETKNKTLEEIEDSFIKGETGA